MIVSTQYIVVYTLGVLTYVFSCSNIIVFCIVISTIILDYVYIHNAFRNDLQSIITSCEEDKFTKGDLEQWKEILDLHSRVEDEIIVVALQARLKQQKKDSNVDDIPEELLSGHGHDSVKQLISKSLECSDNMERLKLLKELAVELDNHLKMEEETMMHLLIENFTRRELWALDSFIVVRVTNIRLYFTLCTCALKVIIILIRIHM